MVWCPWLFARRQCLKFLKNSDVPRSKPLVRDALPASLSAQSFLFTPACPWQYTHKFKWMSTIDPFQTLSNMMRRSSGRMARCAGQLLISTAGQVPTGSRTRHCSIRSTNHHVRDTQSSYSYRPSHGCFIEGITSPVWMSSINIIPVMDLYLLYVGPWFTCVHVCVRVRSFSFLVCVWNLYIYIAWI